MAEYRKIPVEVIAHRIGDDGWPDEIWEGVNRNEIILRSDPTGGLSHADIKAIGGTVRAEIGDWIVCGVNGEFYPCKPDIFQKTYEPAR